MRAGRVILAAFAAVVVAAPLAAFQQAKTTQVHPGKGGSPHVRSEWTIDGATITIEYGRPSVKGRNIFGPQGVIPTGKVWRMGADEATTLTTTKDLMFGSVHVPAGKYTLWALPLEGASPDKPAGKLIINKQTGQWGTAYDEKQDLARVDANVTILEKPVETLTINLVDTPSGATFVMEWATIRAEVPFVVH
jgi:hypothetical protein